VIPASGHAAHVEQPDAFIGVVRDFLHRVERPVPSLPSHPVQEIAS
jgi:hypothetical protein